MRDREVELYERKCVDKLTLLLFFFLNLVVEKSCTVNKKL